MIKVLQENRERVRIKVSLRWLVQAVLLAIIFLYVRGDSFAADLAARQPLMNVPLCVAPGYEHRLIVKFADNVEMRADRSGNLVSLQKADIDKVRRIAATYDMRFSQLISLPNAKIAKLEACAAERSGVAQPDLRGMMIINIDKADDDDLVAAAKVLRELPEVEFTYIQNLGVAPPGDIPPPTPDYVYMQDYRPPDPGLDVDYMWRRGGKGQGIRYSDCEYGWNPDHEDLNDIDIHIEPGQTIHPDVYDLGWDCHGTASVGIAAAVVNSYGCSGIAPDADVYTYPEQTVEEYYRRETCITNAIANSIPGDIVLLEMQTVNFGDDYAPAEVDPAVWIIVKTGTDAGVIVVGAAGNGGQDLDSAPYEPYMSWGDSKAIIIGAGTSNTAHKPKDWSTYGSRVNVQTWGEHVFTIGYGGYVEIGGDKNQRYTSSFNGTSSASAIAAPSCVALQSLAVETIGRRLTPLEMRELLVNTGIPQGGVHHIGPFLDLKQASLHVCDYQTNPIDPDGDGIFGLCDNCIDVYNPDQGDADGDGIGDYCETDADDDGILNEDDNCWICYNPYQENSDADEFGDSCDNCPFIDNPEQYDENGDGIGDFCDGALHIESYQEEIPLADSGQPYYYKFWAVGGMEPYHWTKVSGLPPYPCILTEGDSCVITGTPIYPGKFYLTIAVTDSYEGGRGLHVDTTMIYIQVIGTPQPPVLAAIGPRSVAVNENLSFSVFATDPNGTIPSLTAENLPANAWFTDGGEGTGTFNFNPDPTQLGVHNVRFIASDGVLADSELVEITVKDTYICGDADGSETVDIDDVVFLISYIFAGGPPPDPLEAGDASCNGSVDIDDVVYLISYIFSGGPEPCANCP